MSSYFFGVATKLKEKREENKNSVLLTKENDIAYYC